MYSVYLTSLVLLGRNKFDALVGSEVNERVAIFKKEVELSFVPTIGMQLSGEGWLTPKIEYVIFDVDRKSFFCSVEVDRQIPEKVKGIEAGLDREWHDVAEYLAVAVAAKIRSRDGWMHIADS